MFIPPPFLFLLFFLSFRPPFSAPSSLQQSAAVEPTIRPELIEALLSESLRLHLVQACQGEHVSLQCPRHTHISPLNSFFGRLVPSRELCPSERTAGGGAGEEDTSCDFAETHARVQEQCRAKRKCRLWVRPEAFGERDPCPGTGKYLQIGYKCSPVSFEDQNFCEGQQTRLGCKPGQRLSIYSAHYGRTANGQAMHCDGGKGRQVGQDCVSDVLPQIARRCHAQPWCSFPVDDRFLGNPCPRGTPKYLSIIFVCVNEGVFSDAALRGKLEAMEELGKELDAIRRNNTSKELERPNNGQSAQGAMRHPLLGDDNWMEEMEEEEEGQGNGPKEETTMRPLKMEVQVNGGGPSEERMREEMAKLPIAASEWPWALLADRRGEALPWLLLSLLLFFLLFLSVCLFWQCRARLNERRGRKLAEERAAASTSNSGKFLGRVSNVGQQSPGYLDSDGSSQRLLDTFLPPLLPHHHQPLHPSEIYHGCYLPSGGSSGAASAYEGGCGEAANCGGYYARDAGGGFGGGIGGERAAAAMLLGGPMAMGSGRIGRRMPASLHCYS